MASATSTSNPRTERDGLGEVQAPAWALWGAHTQRAIENFPLSGQRMHPVFIRALGEVKLACLRANAAYLPPDVFAAMETACGQVIAGEVDDHFPVDAYQGGAGTSANMNANEVIANLAEEALGGRRGDYARVHPLRHVNMHQSTNDVYPTALRVAVLHLLKGLEDETARLQEALQDKEHAFHDVVKLGRTQLRDAVPITLGMEAGAWAEAVSRDRWRIFKNRERIKVVNLGGTAVGTGLGAPRDYIFRVVRELRSVTGHNLARAENLVDATQNVDAFVEVSGMLKAMAVNLHKISGDLRLLGMGPHGGPAELNLPPVQAGSSIMAGKVNPVIPEAVTQVALRVMSNDALIAQAAALGSLELNPFLPLVNVALTESLVLLANAARTLRTRCIDGLTADEDRCRAMLLASPMAATVLVPLLGYERVEALVHRAQQEGRSVLEVVRQEGLVPPDRLDDLLSPKRMYKLGYTEETDGLEQPE